MPLLFAFLLAFQGPPASLGVRVTDIEPIEAASSAIYNLRGAVVRQLLPGGAADRAGIRANDIIVAIGSETVNGAADVPLIMTLHKSGDAVIVSLVRPGTKLPWPKLSVNATLGGPIGAVAQSQPAPTSAPASGARVINASGAIPVGPLQSGRCSALAPAGWKMTSGEVGSTADMSNGDGRVYAGWMIRGVARWMAVGYGDAYGDPQASSRYVVNLVSGNLGAGTFNYTGQAQQIGAGFMAQELESPSHKAIILFRLYPPPPLSGKDDYIISLRIAIAPKNVPSDLNTAVGVSASINCSVAFVPPKPGEIALPRPGDPFDRKRKGEAGDLTDYNSQLGTQYAHSPSTGQTYLLDRASQWNDHGPDGPGYYRKVGNTTEKLVPGIQ